MSDPRDCVEKGALKVARGNLAFVGQFEPLVVRARQADRSHLAELGTGVRAGCNKTVIAGLYASRLKVSDLGPQAEADAGVHAEQHK
ncbi:hypothetical protein [Mesorhizobium sp.]|uniref:hypothetical protein n=1 Tax=Mesorhizobium sp. TaxID=1871066 RepID=UPI000FE2DAE4|nr:hypothetical protein [Mesorhizobium sp.]RWN51228.1 MAG: hypothetical protein EOR98_27715 [Mesorhizobium sp.]RWN72325.1 MAG: hypothetical protein EOS02_27735 [Mesorhizobium sp.]RWN72755.1 MAG: hypothetical protein EOS01_27780 [Mesorhizobium sp.]RWN84329.1 MAG: hypothetical protein EOS04_25855 [Mesorhizobium sp.]RWO08770.1 MAG: hypothetical protein EOS15_28900 [Mesorhizobium sp.]